MQNYLNISISLMFLILFFGFVSVSAQISFKDAYSKPGELISEGRNTNPSRELKVTGYRLEVVNLDKPFDLKDGKPPLKAVFRLVIVTKDAFPSADFVVWLDEEPLVPVKLKNNEFALLILTRTLSDGTIKLALSQRGKTEIEDRTFLSGTLSIPTRYRTPIEEIIANHPVINLRRLSRGVPTVELSIQIPNIPCVTTNNPTFIEIDGIDQATNCKGSNYVIWYSAEQFERLRNGAPIVLKRGFGNGVNYAVRREPEMVSGRLQARIEYLRCILRLCPVITFV